MNELPPMTGEQVDRLYSILVFGMGLAAVFGGLVALAAERLFHFC